jgi:hypothetical protein
MNNLLANDINLITYEFLLLIFLVALCRNILLRWIVSWSFFPYIYYVALGYRFNFNKRHDIIFTIFFIILQIAVTVYIIKNHIRKEHFTWRPILTILLFVISLVLHKVLIAQGMPWFTGYILVTLSFITGLILFRNNLNFRKTDRSN